MTMTITDFNMMVTDDDFWHLLFFLSLCFDWFQSQSDGVCSAEGNMWYMMVCAYQATALSILSPESPSLNALKLDEKMDTTVTRRDELR